MLKKLFYNLTINVFLGYLSVCFLFTTQTTDAQNLHKSIRFDHISIEDGLSQSSVNTIAQDQDGYIWLGTQDGLNQFDGYNFTIFYNQPNDTTSIPDNFINHLFVDRSGKLWVSTNNGLCYYDKTNHSFNTIRQSKKQIIYQSIIENHQAYIATNQGLFIYNFKDKSYKNLNDIIIKIGEKISDEVTCIAFDKHHNLWIGTKNQGLFLYLENQKRLVSFYPSEKGIPSYNINKIFIDNKNIWITTNNGIVYAPQSYQSVQEIKFQALQVSSENKYFIPLYKDRNGNYWAGSWGNGLFSFTMQNDSVKNIIRYHHNPIQKNSIASDFIKDIFEDKFGVLWIGTSSGVSKFDPSKQEFIHYTEIPGEKNSLKGKDVWSICETDDKIVWIGTRLGLNRLDRKTEQFAFFDNISQSPVFKENKIIPAIYQRPSNKDLLIGTVNGLYKVHLNNAQMPVMFERINYAEAYKNPDFENRVYCMLEDREQNLWIGTKNGLAVIFPNGKSLFFQHNEKDSTSLPDNTVRAIFQSKNGKIWIGTVGGLSCVEQNENGQIFFKSFQHQYNNENSLSNNMVISIAEDKDNILWIGTYGGGLNRFDSKNNTFNAVTERDGLPNNVVYGILIDDENNLWLSTNRGLSKYNPANNTIVNYNEKDGLQSNEFNIGAYFKNKDGEFYFGGINGFNIFNPQKIQPNPVPPDIHITNVKIINKSFIDTVFNARYSNTINLNFNQNNLIIEYLGIHFTYPQKNQYAYKLVNFDEDWNYVGNTRFAHYTNLPPGEYTFLVKAANSDGIWSNHVEALKIIITPPFWKTLWFQIAAPLTILLIIFLIFRMRIKVIREQKAQLEKVIEERTREIRAQKEKIEQQQKLLLEEKEKTEKLLLNILPQETVDELKGKGKSEPRHYRMATVLFTDFKGFTKIAEKMRPRDLVKKLDSYFIEFDKIIEQHNLEKIKTIGDAYMAVGGVPIRNKSNPIDATLAALKIQHYVNKRAKKDGEEWVIRCGIHTGEVTAGVIGTKRFAYDVWGDTVNVAARMEQHGEPGKVNISGDTYEHVKDLFVCTYRGKVKAKNKGEVDMYFVERILPELSEDAEGVVPNKMFWRYVDLKLYSSINYRKAERFIINLLEEGLDKSLTYHNIRHMKDVCKAVEFLAEGEEISAEELFILKTAALCHDAGFVERYENNEEIGARIARENLPRFGYTPQQIKLIEQLILATKVPQKPKNKLEEIICDADLDYLGREDFFEIGEGLKKEFIAHGIVKDDRSWDELQVKFLSHHKYFTQTAKKHREPLKQKHLEIIKQRLKENKYNDNKR